MTSSTPLARYARAVPPSRRSPAALLTPRAQDEYTILNSKHAIGIHGYVLVYSVTNRKSFDMVRIVYDKIINFCGMNSIPCVIVGSKIDLPNRCVPSSDIAVAQSAALSPRPAPHSLSHASFRQVEDDEAKALAKELDAAFVETSAKNNTNVCESARFPSFPEFSPVRRGTNPKNDTAAKVFELCLAQIEKRQPNNKQEPPASKCLIM